MIEGGVVRCMREKWLGCFEGMSWMEDRLMCLGTYDGVGGGGGGVWGGGGGEGGGGGVGGGGGFAGGGS